VSATVKALLLCFLFSRVVCVPAFLLCPQSKQRCDSERRFLPDAQRQFFASLLAPQRLEINRFARSAKRGQCSFRLEHHRAMTDVNGYQPLVTKDIELGALSASGAGPPEPPPAWHDAWISAAKLEKMTKAGKAAFSATMHLIDVTLDIAMSVNFFMRGLPVFASLNLCFVLLASALAFLYRRKTWRIAPDRVDGEVNKLWVRGLNSEGEPKPGMREFALHAAQLKPFQVTKRSLGRALLVSSTDSSRLIRTIRISCPLQVFTTPVSLLAAESTERL
jgi:hypothetical protein